MKMTDAKQLKLIISNNNIELINTVANINKISASKALEVILDNIRNGLCFGELTLADMSMTAKKEN